MTNKIDLKGITTLNIVMNNNEYFKAAISPDSSIRHVHNIDYCKGIIALYQYLLKNDNYICNIFGSDMYRNSKNLTWLLDKIVWGKYTPRNAIVEFLSKQN